MNKSKRLEVIFHNGEPDGIRTYISNMDFSELNRYENQGAAAGWVSPLSNEDKEFFKYFQSVFKRYNINPSKATRLEYDFVTRVAESEFYLQRANA